MRDKNTGMMPLWLEARGYVLGAMGILAVTLVAQPLRADLNALTVPLVYLVVVLATAVIGGIGAGVATSIASFLALNFYFLPPYHTFIIGAPQDIVALFVFLVVAVVTSQLVSRLQAREREAERRAAELETLAGLTSALLANATLDTVLATIVEGVRRVFAVEAAAILLPTDAGLLAVRLAYPPETAETFLANREHEAVAMHVFASGVAAGVGTTSRALRPHAPGSESSIRQRVRRVLYVPVQAAGRSVSVLGVARGGATEFAAEERLLLAAFADQAALAIDRARLTEEATHAAALAQADQLKTALLAAVSHDLRTPLASIKASATSLLQTDVDWDTETQREFLTAIDEETDRLARLVSNLLDLTRVQGGALKPEKDWYDIEEVIGNVTDRLAPLLALHPIHTEIAPDLPTLSFDFVEIAQVLTNLIENAAKYSDSGAPITVTADWAGDFVRVGVRDRGVGISAADVSLVFDTFYRVRHDGRTRRIGGTGIGLAICRGFVEAHGGTIAAASAPGEGSIFTFTLPVPPTHGNPDQRGDATYTQPGTPVLTGRRCV